MIEEGPDRDPMLGKNNSLYSLSLTLAPEYQELGLGRHIKLAQLREAGQRAQRPTASRATATSPAATASATRRA